MRGKRKCSKARTLEMDKIMESKNERQSDKSGLQHIAAEQKIKHSGKITGREGSSRTAEHPDRR